MRVKRGRDGDKGVRFGSALTLCVGPMPPPVTGQAVAFEQYVTGSKHSTAVVDTNLEGRRFLTRIISTVGNCARILVAVGKRPNVLYLSISRSLRGFWKDFVAIHAAKAAGSRIVVHIHGSDFGKFRECQGALMRWIISRTYRRVDTYIVLLPSLVRQIALEQHQRVVVVSNGFDSRDIPTQAETEQHRSKHGLRVLFLSSVAASKGVLLLAEAVRKLADKGMTVRLDVAGTLVSDEELTADALRAALAKIEGPAIRYRGLLKGREKRQALAEADIVALPSSYVSEALPLGLIEGMASGCYLLVSDHPALQELVGSERGSIVPRNDVGALAVEIERLNHDPGTVRSIGARNRTIAEREFSLSSYINGIDAAIAAA